MGYSLRFHLSYALFAFNCFSICGQGIEPLPYYIQHKIYTTKDGLSKTVINTVFQDSRGFVWLGTDEGINKFDGLNFENHLNNKLFPEDRIYDIKEMTNGGIWFSGFNGIYQYTTDTIINHISDNGEGIHPHYFSINEQQSVFFTDRNNKTAIYQLLPKGLISLVDYTIGSEIDAKPLHLSRIVQINEQQLIIQDVNLNVPFWLMEIGKKELTPLKPKSNGVYQSSSLFVDSLGIYLRFDDEIYTIINDQLQFLHKFKNIVQAFAVHKGKIISTDWRQIQVSAQDDTFEFGLQFAFIRHIIPGKNGIYWLATDDGLVKIQTEALQVFAQERGIFGKVFSIVEDSQNSIWFAAYGNGIQKLKNGRILETVEGYKKLLDSKSSYFYPGARITTDGKILFPTNRNIMVYDPIKGFSVLENSTTNTAIQEIELYNDTLFLASKGFGILTQREGLVFHSNEDSLAMNDLFYLEAIERDKQNIWWLGSHNGLAKKEKDRFTNYIKGEEISDGINSIHSDFKSNLWFGSHNGLLHYDYTSELPLQVCDLEIQGSIQSINSIDSSFLVLGMTNQIILFDLQSFYEGKCNYYELDEENGFLGTECSPNCNILDSQGNVWIGTESSVIKLNPSKLELRNTPKLVHFKSISHRKFPELHYDIISLFDAKNKLLRFSSKDNLRVDFYIVDHVNSNKTKFEYQLKGKHLDWLRSDQRFISFSNLPIGDYELQVRSVLSNNYSQPSILHFKIGADHFYEEKWFIPLIITMLASGVVFFAFREYRKSKDLLKEEEEKLKLTWQLSLNQADPHFTFNILEIISGQIAEGKTNDARNFIGKFGNLFRQILVFDKKVTRTLREELSFVKDYLKLEKLRFKERFDYQIEVSDKVELSSSPKLQPF